MKNFLTKLKRPEVYYKIILLILMPLSYIYGRLHLINQSDTYEVYDSNFTVNILIVFGLVGYLVEQKTKHLSKTKGWIIWAIAIALLVLFFKFVYGLETWW